MEREKTIIDTLEWGKEISNREEKEKVADKIASMVTDNDIIGIGSGSTAYPGPVEDCRTYPERATSYPGNPDFPRNKNDLC